MIIIVTILLYKLMIKASHADGGGDNDVDDDVSVSVAAIVVGTNYCSRRK